MNHWIYTVYRYLHDLRFQYPQVLAQMLCRLQFSMGLQAAFYADRRKRNTGLSEALGWAEGIQQPGNEVQAEGNGADLDLHQRENGSCKITIYNEPFAQYPGNIPI